MAVTKVWDSFDSGLYLLGGREAIPPNAVRVGTGFNPLHAHSMRSRNSNVRLSTNAAISAITFFGNTYTLDASGNFQKNYTNIKTGLTAGSRLSFAKAPPHLGDTAFLFAIGAGAAFKVDSTGAVTNWGIAAPPDNGVTLTDETTIIGKSGTFGILGNYSYYYTFKNSVTGTRSEPNKTTIAITGTNGGAIKIQNLPTTSSDAQVDTLTLWRTLGNGALYYNVVDIKLSTLVATGGTYYDAAGDFAGFGASLSSAGDWIALHNYNANNGVIIKPVTGNAGGYYFLDITPGLNSTGAAAPTWPQNVGATVVDSAITWQNIGTTGILGITQLILGLYTLPPTTATACMYYNGTMFICGNSATGTKGRIYFSAVSEGAEGVAGFTDISNDDDPTVGFATFAGLLYCLTKKGVWLVNDISISSTQPAFSATLLGQAPGCGSLQSIVTSPVGIIYQTSENDLHLFNGYTATNLFAQITVLFDNTTVEGYSTIGQIVAATYGRDEYWFSDGANNLFAVNIMPESLPRDVQNVPRPTRCHGTAATAIYYVPETGSILAGWNSGTYDLEVRGSFVADTGTGSLPFSLRTGSFYSGDKYTAKGQRLLIDINDGGNLISVYVSVDDTDYLLGATDGAGVRKKYEFPFNITGSVIGVYVTTTGGSGMIEVFRIAIEADGSGLDDAGSGGGPQKQLYNALGAIASPNKSLQGGGQK